MEPLTPESPDAPDGDPRDDAAPPAALAETLAQASPEAGREGVRTLVPILYGELRDIASRLLARTPDPALQPTAVVHDAFMKLASSSQVRLEGRPHFLALAARVMRQVLADHAKAARRGKREGGRRRVTLFSGVASAEDDGLRRAIDAEALDDALGRLEAIEPRYARVVELRFYAGLSVEEVAEALGVSPRTVELDWRAARAWLRDRLA